LDFRWYVVLEDTGEDPFENWEVGSVVGRIHGGEKGVVFEAICQVSKRAT
jgi:hypothetical protein